MLMLMIDALLISFLANFFMNSEDASFYDALTPAALISLGNFLLAMLLVPKIGIHGAIPIIVLADSLVFSWTFGLHFRESAQFAVVYLVVKIVLAAGLST